MTLLLTELSNCGIVMGADSAISYMRNGKIDRIDEVGWHKVIRVNTPKSLIGYWGAVGEITNQRFDTWIISKIPSDNEFDISSLADYLSEQLNIAADHKPINGCMGLHIAGYGEWVDGSKRPMLFHVNNGDGQYHIERILSPTTGDLLRVGTKWEAGPRRLFESNKDIPSDKRNLEENLSSLDRICITRNGHFFTYSVIWNQLNKAINFVNKVPHISIPKNPLKLGPRKGLMNCIIGFMIEVQKLSTEWNIVGGEVNCEALGENGFLY